MDAKPSSLDALRIDRSQAPQKSGSGGAWWVLLVVLLLGGAGAWWFTRQKAISVKTVIVQVRSSQDGKGTRTLLNASGYVTTRLDATVSSKITGKVAEILVEEGMKVEKDKVLAKIYASNVESGLRLATAKLESVRRRHAETEPMVKYT